MDVRLLGPLEVVDDSGAPVPVPGGRTRALLGLLASRAPSIVPTDQIIEHLWGKAGIADPEASLYVTVSRLRGAIGEGLVTTSGGGYRLDIPIANTDVERFRLQARRGRQLSTLGHKARAAEVFRQALAQWRGPALSNVTGYEYAESAARELEEERLSVVELLMDAEIDSGGHELVVGELSGLVEAFPYRERLWAQLMLALYRSGRQAEALRTFGRAQQVLGEELGIEPSKELTDLEERILLHDPVLEKTADAAPPEWVEEPEIAVFSAGDRIVQEGAPADSVYWIESGRVQVTRLGDDGAAVVLAELGPGRYFGELASLLGTGRTATVTALTTTTVSVHSSESFRYRLGVERARKETGANPTSALRALVRKGQYLEAFDTAATLVDHGHTDPEIRYLAVLALARSGATMQARKRFDAYALGSVSPESTTPRLATDIPALSARLDKDMALRAMGDERAEWARRSATRYQDAFRIRGSAYLGVNAATMWLVAGDRDAAQRAAAEALEALEIDEPYWGPATEAEAALVLGDLPRAVDALERAGAASQGQHADRATTLRQLGLVCDLIGADPAILRPIRNPTVVHYCGHRILPPGETGRFTVEDEPRVRERLVEVFEEIDAGFGYGSLAAGADIIAAEALLERGAELHVVLPFDRDEFIRASVIPAGDSWVERFERCLASASSVLTATTGEYLDDPVLFDFCSRIAMGDALMRSEHLQSGAHQVAVWDGVETGGTAGTAVDVRSWRATGRPVTVVEVSPGERGTGAGPAQRRQIRAVLFADFAGYSKLSDAQLVAFQDAVMNPLSKALEPYADRLVSARTWGDGLYLVLSDVGTAAECALVLRNTVASLDVSALGLSSLRGMRIAAHATPVFEGWDPIGGSRLIYGAGVTQTARIEPRTPEGEIYTTHPFASLAMLNGDDSFECQYVGTIPTAKGYGSLPLYSLRPRV